MSRKKYEHIAHKSKVRHWDKFRLVFTVLPFKEETNIPLSFYFSSIQKLLLDCPYNMMINLCYSWFQFAAVGWFSTNTGSQVLVRLKIKTE